MPACRSPTPVSLVPGEQQVGKTIIGEAREWQHYGIAEQRREPAFAGRDAPDRYRDIGADDQPPGLIGGVQAAANVVERSPKGCKRIGLLVDVLEGDVAGADCREQLVALPVDARVTDRAARVVPDDEAGRGHDLAADSDGEIFRDLVRCDARSEGSGKIRVN